MLARKKTDISYPSILSAILPTFHSDELPIPVYNGLSSAEEEGSDIDQESHHETQEMLANSNDSSYATPESSTPQQFSQPELNDLVCDLGLPKNQQKL